MRRSAVLVVLALLLAGCGGRATSTTSGPVADLEVHDSDGLNGVVLPTAYDVPHASLTSTSGASYDLSREARRPLTLLFFGYTNCPDVCQVVMANIASALVRLDREQRSRIGMVFVTTDPARDTTKVLRSYLDRFDPTFEGLTGSLPAIVRLGRAFDIPVEKGQKLPSGGYDVAHGAQVVGLLPDGTAPFVWTEGTAPGALCDDLSTILDDKVPGL